MNIKKVDDKPMVIHTKEKPKLKVKGAPETKIKGRNVLTVQHGPKIAGSASGKNVAADAKIKLKRSSVHVTDKKKTVQTKTAADGMEYRGRNGGGTVQERKGNGTTQGRSGPISVSISATLLPSIASPAPIFAVEVVFPTPPFPDVMTITSPIV